jgi:hypothetical protein
VAEVQAAETGGGVEPWELRVEQGFQPCIRDKAKSRPQPLRSLPQTAIFQRTSR